MPHVVQREIEIILIRRWASYIEQPVFLLSPDGDLMYYNDGAGALLGSSYDESGAVTAEELDTIFSTSTVDGAVLPSRDLPVVRALRTRKPQHGRIRFLSLDGVHRTVDVTALPLFGLSETFLGVLAAFWEPEPGPDAG